MAKKKKKRTSIKPNEKTLSNFSNPKDTVKVQGILALFLMRDPNIQNLVGKKYAEAEVMLLEQGWTGVTNGGRGKDHRGGNIRKS